MITETDEVADALALAAQRWPDDRDQRAKLLLRAIEEWARNVVRERDQHRAAILAASGTAFPGEFEVGYLDALREDWSE